MSDENAVDIPREKMSERETMGRMLEQAQAALAELHHEAKRLNHLWLAAEERENAALLQEASARQRVAELENAMVILRCERETVGQMLEQAQASLAGLHHEAKRLNHLWLAAEERENAALLQEASARQRIAELENNMLVVSAERDTTKAMAGQAEALLQRALEEASRLNNRIVEAEREILDLRKAVDLSLLHIDSVGVAASMRRFSSAGVPLYILRDGALAFRHEPRSRTARVVVLSVPKSGTYMYGEILKDLGFLDCGIHGAKWGFADLRWGRKHDILSKLSERNVEVPLEFYVDLIQPGDFLLTHLPCDDETRALLQNFRRVLAVRDLRDCFVSYMRYVAGNRLLPDRSEAWLGLAEGPERMAGFASSAEARQFFKLTEPVLAWRHEADVLTVRYEEVVGDHGPEASTRSLAALARWIGLRDEARVDLPAILGRDTVTASGRRSRWREWWSDAVNEAFTRLGGRALNEALGYN